MIIYIIISLKIMNFPITKLFTTCFQKSKIDILFISTDSDINPRSIPSFAKFPVFLTQSLLTALDNGVSEAFLLFPRLLQIIEQYPDSMQTFKQKVLFKNFKNICLMFLKIAVLKIIYCFRYLKCLAGYSLAGSIKCLLYWINLKQVLFKG